MLRRRLGALCALSLLCALWATPRARAESLVPGSAADVGRDRATAAAWREANLFGTVGDWTEQGMANAMVDAFLHPVSAPARSLDLLEHARHLLGRAIDEPLLGDQWPLPCIRSYEQGADGYATNTGNGFVTAYQFRPSTLAGALERAGYQEYVGVPGYLIPPPVLDIAAWQLLSERGLQPWPTPNAVC